jgi:hypothetical protein
MLTKTKAIVAAALMLGTVSAAWASDNDGGNETGGFVMPGSMDGVNPAYHPRWFPNYASGGNAYGFVPSHHLSHKRIHHEKH